MWVMLCEARAQLILVGPCPQGVVVLFFFYAWFVTITSLCIVDTLCCIYVSGMRRNFALPVREAFVNHLLLLLLSVKLKQVGGYAPISC